MTAAIFVKFQRLGKFTPHPGAPERFIVLALFSMAASVPEVNNGNQFLVFNLLLHGKNEIEVVKCIIRVVA